MHGGQGNSRVGVLWRLRVWEGKSLRWWCGFVTERNADYGNPSWSLPWTCPDALTLCPPPPHMVGMTQCEKCNREGGEVGTSDHALKRNGMTNHNKICNALAKEGEANAWSVWWERWLWMSDGNVRVPVYVCVRGRGYWVVLQQRDVPANY